MEKLTREIRQEVSKMLGRIEAIYVKNGFKRMINQSYAFQIVMATLSPPSMEFIQSPAHCIPVRAPTDSILQTQANPREKSFEIKIRNTERGQVKPNTGSLAKTRYAYVTKQQDRIIKELVMNKIRSGGKLTKQDIQKIAKSVCSNSKFKASISWVDGFLTKNRKIDDYYKTARMRRIADELLEDIDHDSPTAPKKPNTRFQPSKGYQSSGGMFQQ